VQARDWPGGTGEAAPILTSRLRIIVHSIWAMPWMGGGADEVLLLSSEHLWQSKEPHLSLISLACVAGTGVLQIWLRCAPLCLLALVSLYRSSRTVVLLDDIHTYCCPRTTYWMGAVLISRLCLLSPRAISNFHVRRRRFHLVRHCRRYWRHGVSGWRGAIVLTHSDSNSALLRRIRPSLHVQQHNTWN
jgi:hypothetical protein